MRDRHHLLLPAVNSAPGAQAAGEFLGENPERALLAVAAAICAPGDRPAPSGWPASQWLIIRFSATLRSGKIPEFSGA